MKTPLAAITVGFTLLMGAASANAVSIFDGLSLPSQTPAQQGWSYQSTSAPTIPSLKATSGGTILDSGSNINYAGFFRQSPVTLDRSGKGYSISFSVKVDSESHSSTNRAGFSLIVTSSPLAGETQPYSIELGFWQNSIWAQNVGFTQGEKATFDTQSAVVNYNLYVQGNQYQLFANGSATPILKGNLRQYQFTPPAGYINPYTTPNLLFLGDNTTSAKAKITLTRVFATLVN